MFGKFHDELPAPPSPVPVVDVEGLSAWHADMSPFWQFEVVESCC